MGLRAYFLIDLKEDCGDEKEDGVLKELDAMDEIDFADAVIGEADIVAMVEATTSVDEVAKRVRRIEAVADVRVFRVVGAEKRRAAKKSKFEK